MARTRNIYHYAIRKVKKLSEKIRASNLLDASLQGDLNLLKEMKKVKGGKKETLDLPESVEDADSPEEIVEKFREVYEELYNSADTSKAVNLLKEKLAQMIDNKSLSDVNKITPEVVKKAATHMMPNKSDVTGSYTSDLLLHAPDSMFAALASVFRSWLVHGTVTKHLLVCAFMPLLKSSLKDPASTDSYRAIAGSSQVLKLFDNVVLEVWGHLFHSDSLQFGFKPGFSTTQCSYLVQEIYGHYLRQKTPVLSTLCDCSRAFDKCRFDLLFKKLLDRNVPAIVVRVLIFSYEKQVAWVKWGNVTSKQFGVKNGTRQGAVLSPRHLPCTWITC